MSDAQRISQTLETVFRVPPSVPPYVPPPPPTFEAELARAKTGELGQWQTFTRDECKELWAAYWEAQWSYEVQREIGVPSRLADANLAGTSTAALDRARQYMTALEAWPDGTDVTTEYGQGCCLVLSGPTGVGKSYAAVAIIRALQAHGYRNGPVKRRFRYFPALCGALLDPARRQEALSEATTARVLVLDDLGVEYVKEGGLIDTFLDEIIWTRESEFLPTIITTNLTTEALKQRLPGRLVDRLRGDWGRVFECPGESLRTP